MRAVLDTNVIISATLIRGGNEDRILRAWQRGAFELVLPAQILEEMARALFYERFGKFRWMSEEEVLALLQSLTDGSLHMPGKLAVEASRDPEDDKFLGATMEARAAYVVTGDKDLLDLLAYEGVRIITPAQFLKVLRTQKRE